MRDFMSNDLNSFREFTALQLAGSRKQIPPGAWSCRTVRALSSPFVHVLAAHGLHFVGHGKGWLPLSRFFQMQSLVWKLLIHSRILQGSAGAVCLLSYILVMQCAAKSRRDTENATIRWIAPFCNFAYAPTYDFHNPPYGFGKGKWLKPCVFCI